MKCLIFRNFIISVLVFILICVTAAVISAVETHKINTSLEAESSRITINGSRETIRLDGPIDFNHKGRNLKGDSGLLELRRDEDGESRTPVIIKISGKVRYEDNEYKAKCSNAIFNFETQIAEFIGRVSVEGKDILLKADETTYDKELKVFTARKNIHHEGISRRFPLLLEEENNPEIITYTLDSDMIEIDRKKGIARAEGSVIFKAGTTQITCDKVNLVFDDNEIIEVECEGNVEFTDPDMIGKASTAEYSKKEGTLKLISGSSADKVAVEYKGHKMEGRIATLSLVNGRELTLDEGSFKITSER